MVTLEGIRMAIAYFALVPLVITGIGLFLKGHKVGYKIAGLVLFFASLVGLLIIPALLRQ